MKPTLRLGSILRLTLCSPRSSTGPTSAHAGSDIMIIGRGAAARHILEPISISFTWRRNMSAAAQKGPIHFGPFEVTTQVRRRSWTKTAANPSTTCLSLPTYTSHLHEFRSCPISRLELHTAPPRDYPSHCTASSIFSLQHPVPHLPILTTDNTRRARVRVRGETR